MLAAVQLRTVSPGDRVGPYEILDVIAEGAMGRVCRARIPGHGGRRSEGRTVALKILRPDAADGAEVVARFLRETEIAGQLAHPHVATLLDAGEDDGRFYIAMEYAEGENLARRLQREGQLPVALALDLLLPVCAALDSVHAAGVVHRDVKPDNVLLAWSGLGVVRPLLLDFGVSKSLRGSVAPITRASLTLGTPQFMAPEQTRGARFIDRRSDQYSFAVMLYLALTGRLPHEGTDLHELMVSISQGRVEPPRTHRPDLSQRLEFVILRALCRDAAGRYASMRDLGLALLPFASEETRARWTPVFKNQATCDEPVMVRVPWSITDDAPDVTLVDRYDTVHLSRVQLAPWDPDLPVLARKPALVSVPAPIDPQPERPRPQTLAPTSTPKPPLGIAPLSPGAPTPDEVSTSGVRERLRSGPWTPPSSDATQRLAAVSAPRRRLRKALVASGLFLAALLLVVLVR